MERKKTAKFIDNFSITAIIVFLCFLTLRKYFVNNTLCLTLSVLIGFLFLKIILYFQNKHFIKLKISNQEKKNIEKLNFLLRTIPHKKQLDFFKQTLSCCNIKNIKNTLIINDKIILYICMNEDNISSSTIFNCYINSIDILTYYKNINIEEILIIGNNIFEAERLLLSKFKEFNFTFFSPTETYALVKKHNNLPEYIFEEKTQKNKKTMIKIALFNKNQTKTLYKCALFVYVSSLFIPFTKYYLLIAGALFLLATINLIIKTKPDKIPTFSQLLLDNN